MVSLLAGASLLGLAGCGSGSSDSSINQVRMLTPEELSEVKTVQQKVDDEERAHQAELRKGVRPSR